VRALGWFVFWIIVVAVTGVLWASLDVLTAHG
jgi:hypothetical protein